jgi:hypothetical protein
MPACRHIALLRGINVGGRNRVATADLRKVVLGLGYTDVATHARRVPRSARNVSAWRTLYR